MNAQFLRRMAVLLIPVLMAVVFVIVGTAIVGTYDIRTARKTLDSVSEAGRQRIDDAVRQDALVLESIRAYWLGSNEVTREEFGVYSASLARSFRGLHSTQWVDPQNVVRYVYPLEGENVKAVDFDNNLYPNRLAPITKARETRMTVVTKPIMLVQGFPGVVMYVPIFRGDDYLGSAVGIINLQTLLGPMQSQLRAFGADGYVDAGGTVVTLDGREIYGPDGERVLGLSDESATEGSSPVAMRLFEKRTLDVAVADMPWHLVVGSSAPIAFRIPTVLSMVMGTLFVLLLATTLVLFDRQNGRLRAIAIRERDFVSLVSHQLRLPLTQLSWMLDSSFGAKLPKEQSDAVADMRTIVHGSVKIVTDLLNVSRIDRGVLKLEFEELPVAALIDEVLLPFKETGVSRKVRLDVDVPPGLSAYVDRQKAVEALRNVVDNAIKYSPEGTAVGVSAADAGAGMFRVTIRDDGKGIPKETRDHIFEKSSLFARKGTGEGAGLGLYLTKRFVELMGGKVTFETSEKGTTFFITLRSEKGA